MLVDLHAKSSASEGVFIDAESVIKRAKEFGLDAVAFTEASRTSHANELIKLGEKHEMNIFVGIEISTDRGILLCFPPNIDTFLLEEEWRQANELTTPAADYVIEMVQSIGGAIVASRPYDLEIPHNMGDWIFRIDGINAVEVFNPKVGRIQSDFAQEAAQSLTLPTTGGSDPCKSVDDVGKYATYFKDSCSSQSEFVENLKGEDYWSILIGDVDQERSSRTPSRNNDQPKESRHSSNRKNSNYKRSRSRHSKSSRQHKRGERGSSRRRR